MGNFVRQYKGILILVAVFLSLNAVFFYVSPEAIVEKVGIENTYLTLFLIASLGGLNTFTSGVLYASIVAFSSGGASPWLLGLAGGLGIAVGDVIMYLLFKYGSSHFSESVEAKVAKVQQWLEKFSKPVQYLFIYLYLGFSPLPNDVLMFGLAVFRYRLITVFPLIVAGGITIATLFALLGERLPFVG